MTIKFQSKYPYKTFSFESKTNKDIIYKTELWFDRITCNCPASSFKNQVCWHKKRVEDILKAEFGGVKEAVESYKQSDRRILAEYKE